jgi:serine/threonine-protein kinase
MTTRIGDQVGNCILIRKLADGGMGSVWMAWHRGLARDVAVKLLTPGQPDDTGQRRRFSLEAGVAGRIHSPHVPEVFETGLSADGAPYLVMTLLDGVDLGTHLATRGHLRIEEVGTILDQIGLALAAVHDVGIVHRDVKPQNIILSHVDRPNFEAHLIDFGIAKSTSPSSAPVLTRPGTIVGTPSYMSPEQLAGRESLDPRTDIWSLGVVAYLCVTGVLPFTGGNFRELCLAIYAGEFVPASRRRPEIPPAIDAWFDKVLADRRERFSSVATMTAAFRAAMVRGPVRSQAITLTEVSSGRPAPPCVLEPRRHSEARPAPVTITWALSGAVLGALGSAFAMFILGGASPLGTHPVLTPVPATELPSPRQEGLAGGSASAPAPAERDAALVTSTDAVAP